MTTPQMDWLDDQRRKRAVSGDDIVDELQFRVTVTRLGGQHAAREVMSDIVAMENARAEIVRLRAERKAIEAIHQPMGKPAACCTCWKSWPCRTHLLLHPEEARRG